MIISAILYVVDLFIEAIFAVIPNIPPMPTAITTALDWFKVNIVEEAISVVSYIYGQSFLDAMIIIIVALLVFDYAYALAMWVLKKLPLPIN